MFAQGPQSSGLVTRYLTQRCRYWIKPLLGGTQGSADNKTLLPNHAKQKTARTLSDMARLPVVDLELK